MISDKGELVLIDSRADNEPINPSRLPRMPGSRWSPWLIRRAKVNSPLINSIQLRAYLNVTMTDLEIRPNATQCVAEFVMQPRQLMLGESAMMAVGPKDRRYKTLDGTDGKLDMFEVGGGAAILSMEPRLQQCVFCQGKSRSGVRSLSDFTLGDRIADRYTYEAGSPVKIALGVAAIKRKNETWKKLQSLWPRASNPKDDDQVNAP